MQTARAPSSAPSVQEINVTPMIDVLLVLLIIYMVMSQTRMGIPTQVPPEPERSATPTPAPAQIVLELTADGGYAINSQPVPAAELRAQLAAIYAERTAKLLFVKASPERRYQEVVSAMDLARGAGVQVVALMPEAGR